MADRSYSYRFLGNFSNLGTGLAVAGRQVNELGGKLTTLDKQGAIARRGLTTIGTTAGKIGLVAAAGVGAVVISAANFEQAMSNVRAATHETADNMDLLRQAAIQAGQDTQFSATEAAQAVEELAKAGVSTADILGGGLSGAMSLAAAGGLDVADAAQIAATALTQFHLAGEDVPHVADLLAAGAGKAQGDVSDLSMALKQSGLVASQMGISIEETTGTLAAFASAGLLGSDAGTSFRTMLLRMANPSTQAEKQMRALGISAYDAQGNFVGIADLSHQLQVAFQGQTQATRDSALATIFGSDAIRAANVLYNQGAAGIQDWTDKVNDQGYAAETAAIKMDNLRGDLEQLKGSLETAFIGAGGSSQGPLRSLVQGATSAVNAFNELPGPIQSSVTALGGITAITGGGLWFGSKVIRGITDTKQALKDMGVQADFASSALKGVAVAGGALAVLDVVGASVDALEKKFDRALPSTEALTKALLDMTSAQTAQQLSKDIGDLGDAVDRLNADGLQGFSDQLSNLAADHNVLRGAEILGSFGTSLIGQGPGSESDIRQLREYAASIDAVDQALANIVTTGSPEQGREAFTQLAAAQGLSKDQQEELLKLLPDYNDALDASANQATLAAGATDDYSSATTGLATSADDAKQSLDDMLKSMRDATDAAVSGFDAETRYRQAVKDAAKQAEKNNAGIKGSTKAALANRDSLGQLAAAWNAHDQVVLNNNKLYNEARQNFIDTATAMGVPKKAAKQLADTLLQMPDSKIIKTSAPGMADVLEKSRTLKEILDSLHSKDINIALHYQTIGNRPHAPLPGAPNDRRAPISPRSSGGLDVRVPSMRELNDGKEAYAAQALGLLAKNSDEAAKGSKGLKEQLHDAEQRLERLSRAAADAHDALQKLKDDKDSLESSVIGSLEHDAFGGSLQDFETQTAADTADAQAVLAALQQLVANGLDPHSQLFQRLAASGNVALIQQFAALSRSQLAAEAASFAAGQTALSAVGQFVGNEAFNDLIAAQRKVTEHLDDSVRHLTHVVNHLQNEVSHMKDHVKQGAKEGSKEGSEEGTRRGNEDRDRRTHHRVRTGA